MKLIIMLLLAATPYFSLCQTSSEKPKILYGKCSKDSLITGPFSNWFTPGYDSYKPAASVVHDLRNQYLDNISMKIFFGTWCGDSKREVPRFLKLLNSISFPEKKTEIIALGDSDSLYKQSPGHEEAGLGIFRVPTFIIYKNGVELNRINEFPVNSLEKDLLEVLNGQLYSPNYRSFSKIKQWLNDGSLLDENISIRGFAEQLRPMVASEHDLNSLGYVLLKQGKKKEALQVFRMNYLLFSESSNIASSLGEGYYETGDYKKAIHFLETSLELNKDPKAVKGIVEILYKAKEKDKE